MKKVAALFFFFIIVLCSSGFYLAFYISMHQVKQSQRKIIASGNLNNDHIFVFSFSAADLQNNKANIELEESELKYNGKMYDIISKMEKNGMISISCIADGSEDYLLSLMGNSFYRLRKEKNTNHLLQLKWQIDNYTFEATDISDFNFKDQKLYGPQVWTNLILSHYKNVPSPPPWQMFI